MTKRIQIFNISIKDQCSECIYSEPSDLFDEEYLCNKKCDEILYPESRGTEKCPHFDDSED